VNSRGWRRRQTGKPFANRAPKSLNCILDDNSIEKTPNSMADMQPLVAWFERQGGELDSSAIGFAEFPAEDGGRGAIVVRDLPVRGFA
jgi:hypothetical protein